MPHQRQRGRLNPGSARERYEAPFCRKSIHYGAVGLTVGGTLSIGGISPATYRYGAQVDNVLALQVITGEGKIVSCSDTHNRNLFEAALAIALPGHACDRLGIPRLSRRSRH